MPLPKFLQPYLASYDIKKLNADNQAVKKEVITQVLNVGNIEVIKWLFGKYKDNDIKEVLVNPKRGSWFARSLSYWLKIFSLEKSVGKEKYNLATRNI